MLVPLHSAPHDAVAEIDALYDVYLAIVNKWGTDVSAPGTRAGAEPQGPFSSRWVPALRPPRLVEGWWAGDPASALFPATGDALAPRADPHGRAGVEGSPSPQLPQAPPCPHRRTSCSWGTSTPTAPTSSRATGRPSACAPATYSSGCSPIAPTPPWASQTVPMTGEYHHRPPPQHPGTPCPSCTTSGPAWGQEQDPPPVSSRQDRGVWRQAQEKHRA